jgi:hypothetical protein
MVLRYWISSLLLMMFSLVYGQSVQQSLTDLGSSLQQLGSSMSGAGMTAGILGSPDEIITAQVFLYFYITGNKSGWFEIALPNQEQGTRGDLSQEFDALADDFRKQFEDRKSPFSFTIRSVAPNTIELTPRPILLAKLQKIFSTNATKFSFELLEEDMPSDGEAIATEASLSLDELSDDNCRTMLTDTQFWKATEGIQGKRGVWKGKQRRGRKRCGGMACQGGKCAIRRGGRGGRRRGNR